MKATADRFAPALLIGAVLALFAFQIAFAAPDNGNGGVGNGNGNGNLKHAAVCPTPEKDGARCNAQVVVGPDGKVQTNVIPAGVGPAQLHVAYTSATSTSAKRIIGIVDAYDDPNIANDLATYGTTFGIPALPSCTVASATAAKPCFQKVDQNGGTRYPSANAGWSLEIALDVETAHAMCQNCSILLVEAGSASFSNLIAAEDRAAAMGATVISNSWGGNEFSQETSASYDGHFNKPGVAITVSSGDSGYGVEYPASSRYVTAVGGTTLFFTSAGAYSSESAWSGAGSGCSSYESQQSWQTALTLPGCSHRIVADVSADADPNSGAAVYDTLTYQGQKGWFQVGGTSLASPIVAGVYALSGNMGSNTTPANAVPYLPVSAAFLHDVVGGSNGSCGGTYLCTAVSGYDGPTGLGTPKGVSAF